MNDLLDQISAGEAVPAEVLARALLWPEREQLRRPLFDGCLLLRLGEEPALAIADHGDDPLAFAYHAGYEWVLDVRPGNPARFVNTRWRSLEGVYQLPLGVDASDMVASLTPAGFEDDRPSRIARSRLPVESQVATIEATLIRKLGDFRRMAFRYSAAEPADIDQAVHLFVTQLFVLRAIEDLGLGQGIGLQPLSSTVTNNILDTSKLEAIFHVAREQVQPTLFDDVRFDVVAPAAIVEAIKALYSQIEVPNVPRLNFGWIDPDVFGRVYERYLSTVLSEGPVPSQPALFETATREVEEVSRRRQGGVYYTPQPLVRILVQKALDIARPEGLRLDNLPRIADFACGSGAFLAGALDKVLSSLPRGERTAAAKRLISERLIVGVDVDPRSVALARLNIYLRLAQEQEMLPLPDVNSCVLQGDSLAASLPGDLDHLAYEAVVGNPPFLPTSQIENRESLEARFSTATGRYDFSSLFVELAVKKVAEGGATALVVPNRLISNASAQVVRDYVLERCTLDTLVDFGSAQVFSGVTAYVGLLICRKGLEGSNPQGVRFVSAKQVSEPFGLEPVARAIFSVEEIEDSNVESFWERQPKAGDPWSTASPSVRILLNALNSEGVSLGEIADIKQGIKTGANYVFVVRLLEYASGELTKIEDGNGRIHLLESALLRTAALGPEVTRYREFGPADVGDQLILYPYANGRALPEHTLSEQFPSAYKFLSEYRRELESRGSVAKSGQPWYGLIWPREYEWLASKKILTRDLISKPSFAIDQGAGVFIVGGTAIIPANEDDLLTLLGVVNSSSFEVIMRQGSSEFRGRYMKAEPGRLMAMSIPLPLLDDPDIPDLVLRRLRTPEAAGSEVEAEIDEIVTRYLRDIQS